MSKFKTVNRVLGERPNLGPFPADMILPWSTISIGSVFIVRYLLHGTWLVTGLCVAWGISSWWIITSNKQFRGKFVGVPRINRGYMPYSPLVNLGEEQPKNTTYHDQKIRK